MTNLERVLQWQRKNRDKFLSNKKIYNANWKDRCDPEEFRRKHNEGTQRWRNWEKIKRTFLNILLD